MLLTWSRAFFFQRRSFCQEYRPDPFSTILAEQTGGVFLDGDDFHPPRNVKKMAKGEPLGDADREGWLIAIREAVDAHGGAWPLFIGCSALKRKYRDLLRSGERGSGVGFVHLSGSRELLDERMAAREGHFMKPGMLDSQFADLERLGEDEPGFAVSIAPTPERIARAVVDLF